MNISEQYIHDLLEEKPLPAVTSAVNLLEHWVKQHYYPSKNKRLFELWDSNPDFYRIILTIFTITLTHTNITMQMMMGLLKDRVGCEDERDSLITAGEIVAIVARSKLIQVITGNIITIHPGYDIGEEIPVENKHRVIQNKPLKLKSNNDSYGWVILGHKMNRHHETLDLAHLDRMNAIPLSLNIELLKAHKEEPTFDLDTQEKRDQWAKFKEDSIHKYIDICKYRENQFFLEHKYDTRGRCYATGYHVSSQGTSFKKAIIQLKNKEIVI